MKAGSMRTSGFKPNPRNPRTITDPQLAALKAAMVEFGDLSGLVVNRKSGNMIGGHQRVKILADLPVTIYHRFDPPTKRGTVAEGFVEYSGERFIYREVIWTDTMEKAAMIAANKHGGDFNTALLADLLRELKEDDFTMDLTGFSESELNRMLAFDQPTIRGLENIDIGNEIRLVQLQLTTETLPTFLERVRQLGEKYGTLDNVTDTVFRAVAECHERQIQQNGIQLSTTNGPVETVDPAIEPEVATARDPNALDPLVVQQFGSKN